MPKPKELEDRNHQAKLANEYRQDIKEAISEARRDELSTLLRHLKNAGIHPFPKSLFQLDTVDLSDTSKTTIYRQEVTDYIEDRLKELSEKETNGTSRTVN